MHQPCKSQKERNKVANSCSYGWRARRIPSSQPVGYRMITLASNSATLARERAQQLQGEIILAMNPKPLSIVRWQDCPNCAHQTFPTTRSRSVRCSRSRMMLCSPDGDEERPASQATNAASEFARSRLSDDRGAQDNIQGGRLWVLPHSHPFKIWCETAE